MRAVRLQWPLTDTAARTLELGDAVFLSGLIFTGREGFYHLVIEKGLQPPLDLGHTCNITFHCSPAVSELRPGEYHIPSITATASFRFAKYVPLLLERYGIRAVIGKGGMQEEVYQTAFRQHSAIYLTTVG
jgi:L(+)-tartrate dehydratase beta subunit